MNAGMKMLMLTNARGGRSGGRMEALKDNYARMGYDGAGGSYDAESRYRDRRGREHYDNGRFAPRNNMGYGEMESNYGRSEMGGGREHERMEMGYRPSPDSAEGGERMNQIGFRAGPEIGSNYRMDAGYQGNNEVEYRTSPVSVGRTENALKLTRWMADEWMAQIQNEDGTHGPHWTLEQTKQVMAQKGAKIDPLEFWVILNSMYADYCKVLKKYGVGDKLDLYVDMAKAFIEDKTLGKGK